LIKININLLEICSYLNENELNHLRELIDNAREFISSETKFFLLLALLGYKRNLEKICCLKKKKKIYKKIKNFINKTPITTLLKIQDFKIYDREFRSIERKQNNLRIYKKYLPLYKNDYENDEKKLTFKLSLNCSQECASLYFHIISIIEFSFCIEKLHLLTKRLNNLKKYIRIQEERIECLKNNYKKILEKEFKINIEDTCKLFNFKTMYKEHILIE
jgi:hypothetical protein